MRLWNHVNRHPQRLLLTALVVLIVAWAGVIYAIVEQRNIVEQNKERIAENALTAQALCDAAGGARDFWIKVRLSTIDLLSDPDLSPFERRSNEGFKKALTEVIASADGLARSCDQH